MRSEADQQELDRIKGELKALIAQMARDVESNIPALEHRASGVVELVRQWHATATGRHKGGWAS